MAADEIIGGAWGVAPEAPWKIEECEEEAWRATPAASGKTEVAWRGAPGATGTVTDAWRETPEAPCELKAAWRETPEAAGSASPKHPGAPQPWGGFGGAGRSSFDEARNKDERPHEGTREEPTGEHEGEHN